MIGSAALAMLMTACSLNPHKTDTPSAISPASEKLRIQKTLQKIPGIAFSNPVFTRTPLSRTVYLLLEMNTADVQRLVAAHRYATELVCSNDANRNPGVIYETISWSEGLGPDAVNKGPKPLIASYVTTTPGLKLKGNASSSVAIVDANCHKFLKGSRSVGSSSHEVPQELLTPVPILTAVPNPKP
jgi:hypothetical protein